MPLPSFAPPPPLNPRDVMIRPVSLDRDQWQNYSCWLAKVLVTGQSFSGSLADDLASVPHWPFFQFPLQGAPVHVEQTCRGRNIALLRLKYVLDVFPFQAFYTGGL